MTFRSPRMKSATLLVLISMQLCWCKNPYPKDLVPIQPAVREKCMAETGASLDLIKKCEENDFTMGDRALMCYSECVIRQFGGLKADGSVDAEKLAGLFGPDEQQYADMVMKCMNIGGADSCEISYLTHKCHFDVMPEVAFFV